MKKNIFAIVLYAVTCFPPLGGIKGGCQNIGINTIGATPNAKALLDIAGTSGGLLIPRMTTTQRDALAPSTTEESLLIYNTTTDCFEAYNAATSTWVAFGCIGCSVPSAVTASPTPNPICVGSTLTLTGGATDATSWNWTGPNSYTSSAQSPTIAGITTAGAGVYTLSAGNNCGWSAQVNTASVSVSTAPTTAAAGSDITPACGVSTATLSGNNPVVGTGLWTLISGTATITNNTLYNSGVTGLAVPGTTTLRWTISNAPCADSFDEVTITTTCCGGTLNWAQTSNQNANSDFFACTAVDATGVYLGGQYQPSAGNDAWIIEKRNLTNGSVIWTQTLDPTTASGERAEGIALDGTGVYVVGADQSPGTNTQWRIEKRSLSTGAVIWSVTSDPTINNDVPLDVTVDATGVYIAGWQNNGLDIGWRIEKRNISDGSITWAQTNNISAAWDEATAIAVDATGVYIAGHDTSPGDEQWHIEKRDLSTGAIIWTQTINPSVTLDRAWAIEVDGTGVYIGGGSSGNTVWRCEKRNLSTGAVIWTQSSVAGAGTIAVDGTGLYIAGGQMNLSSWQMQKRDPSDGTLIWSYSNNPSASEDDIMGIALDGTGIYLGGYDSSPGNRELRVEKICK